MGVCQTLSNQQRIISEQNKQIKLLFLAELKELPLYQFSQPLKNMIKSMPDKYLVNLKILQDREKLMSLGRENSILKNEIGFENFQEQVKNSCLILEDEITRQKEEQDLTESFQDNIQKHESLVMQIKVIYETEFDKKKYKKSLQYFLLWANTFNQHLEKGFLKPIYWQFCQSLYKRKQVDVSSVFEEARIFVLMMIVIYTHTYRLKKIYGTSSGKLFKNENIFSLIMSYLFRRTKIRKYLKLLITQSEKGRIEKFKEKLQQVKDKEPAFFGVPNKFSLMREKNENRPYEECVKLVHELCQESQTPITKLKIIVRMSIRINKQIENYYQFEEVGPPQLDPDSLLSIVMYIVSKANNYLILEELKIVENFTTNNSMNSISGYYLQTFNAAIQTILTI